VATSASYGEILHTIHFLHGPKVFVGRDLSGIEDLDVSRLEEAIKLIEVGLKVLSGDLGVAAYVDTSESSSSLSGSRPCVEPSGSPETANAWGAFKNS